MRFNALDAKFSIPQEKEKKPDRTEKTARSGRRQGI